jgi:hypothetical protein
MLLLGISSTKQRCASLTTKSDLSVTKFIAMSALNLVAAKATAKLISLTNQRPDSLTPKSDLSQTKSIAIEKSEFLFNKSP